MCNSLLSALQNLGVYRHCFTVLVYLWGIRMTTPPRDTGRMLVNTVEGVKW